MSSVSHEGLLPQVEQAILNVLCEAAHRLQRSSGFIQRLNKTSGVTGASFVQMLVLGWLQTPDASLEALVQFGEEVGIHLTGQGLDERFSEQAVTLMQQVFEVALAQVVMADPVAVPLLQRFAGIVLEDSSIVRLPDAFADLFRGCGGSQEGKGTASSFKVFVRLEMLRGQLECSSLLDGRHAETRTPFRTSSSVSRTLQVRDRGFADLHRWREEAERGEEVLSYYKAGIHLLTRQAESLDLLAWLRQVESQAELEVLVGEQVRLPMRLLVERVPDEQRRQRQARQRQEAQKHGRCVPLESEELAGWTLVLTTASADLLTVSEAMIVVRLRWQIELLFKLWKQDGLLDEWRTQKRERILCEIYGKFIGLLVLHWLLIVGCWHQPHRSLPKAAKAVRSRAILLAVALSGGMLLREATRRIQRATARGSQVNHRRKAPTTSQMVESGSNVWANHPHPPKKRGRKKLNHS
ncbi:MAG TPA: IS4 family transposase [Ktedonobacter sp.]|nr:IS4 family transposase [Ktedonobacter sp.]